MNQAHDDDGIIDLRALASTPPPRGAFAIPSPLASEPPPAVEPAPAAATLTPSASAEPSTAADAPSTRKSRNGKARAGGAKSKPAKAPVTKASDPCHCRGDFQCNIRCAANK